MSDLKCVVCGEKLTGIYWLDGWGNCACERHKSFRCYSCWRFIGKGSTYSPITKQIGFRVDNERYICALCKDTCVNSTKELNKSVDFVIDLLGKAGFKIVREGIRDVKVITREEMTKKSPGAEGLCVSYLCPNQPSKTTSEIFILNGLPKIRFEGVLAHEMLHYWVFYNGVDGGDCTEGFCNIGESLVHNYYASRAGSALAEHLRENANNNTEYYYGQKYIEQKNKLKKLGWEKYIKDILKRKKITP